MPSQQHEQSPAVVTFAHPIGTRDGSLSKDALMANLIPERSELGMAVVKRPGMGLQRTVLAGVAQGQFGLAGAAYAITNDTAYPNAGISLAIPSPGPGGDQYQSLDDYTSGKTLLKNTSGMWVVTAGAATKVSSTNYPAATVPGLAELDGTYYVMASSDGTIRGSAVQDPTSWGPLNFVGPNSSLGAPVRIHRHLNYIVGLYDKGMQLFYDAQNPTGSPLSPVENAAWLTGCASAGSVVELSDGMFFMSKDSAKGRSITKLVGLQPTIISDPYVDRILARDSLVGVRAFGIRIAGHSLYCLTLPASNVTLVYDLVYQLWGAWSSMVAGVEGAFVGCNYLNALGLDLLQDATTGAVYYMDPALYRDNGNVIRARSRTSPRDWGTMRRKFLPMSYLFADTVASTCTLSWTDDDYQTFTTPRTIDLSTVKKQLTRCGSSRKRAWEIVHTDNTPFRVYGLECEPEAGAS